MPNPELMPAGVGLSARLAAGARVKATRLSDSFDFAPSAASAPVPGGS